MYESRGDPYTESLMNTRFALVTLLCVALLGSYVYGRQFGSQPSKLDIVKVKDDLFVIHNEFVPGNSTALVTSEGVVLVDDKFEVDADNILAMLKKVTNQPVKYVIRKMLMADFHWADLHLNRGFEGLLAELQ
jgi:hypothetical protein